MAAPIELETARLRMRVWREADRAPFAAMNRDPEVMRYFPAPIDAARSDASIDAWLGQFAAQGWSNWALERKDDGAFLGFVGLSVPARRFPFSPCVEVGWRLAREHWHRGYASEAAKVALRAGFEQIGLDEIVSMTALANAPSRAVMERIGLENRHADFDHPGIPSGHPLCRHCLYAIDRATWRARLAPADAAD
ncbi:MAG TPA: GNAT family N-acetyltransferase [Caldimonas sp.]|nr:GNAT family N-acetyltransferase [Caldimonas sp.]